MLLYCIVLNKVFVIGWRKEIIWTYDGEGLTTHDWMTVSLYRKYNTFSDRESEQKHKT